MNICCSFCITVRGTYTSGNIYPTNDTLLCSPRHSVHQRRRSCLSFLPAQLSTKGGVSGPSRQREPPAGPVMDGDRQALLSLLGLSEPLLGSGNSTGGPGDDPAFVPKGLSLVSLAMAALLIVINVALSVRLALGLTSRLLVAGVRCVIQLSVLGFVLEPIFNFGSGPDGERRGESVWWLVVLYTTLMLMVAGIEAAARPASAYRWMLTHVWLSMGSSVALVLTYVLLVIVRVAPWWNAQYFIPIVGMLLGNATSGVSLALSNLLDSLTTRRGEVETMLALGATRWEATQAHVHRAIITGMTPVLNQMSVVGVVSIPGMMTGQILGGQAPMEASRYQIIIMFAILASTTIACVMSVYLATSQLVDASHCFRPDRVAQRTQKIGGMFQWIAHKVSKIAIRLRMYWVRISARLLCCGPRSRVAGNGLGWRRRWAGSAGALGDLLDSPEDTHSHSMDVLTTPTPEATELYDEDDAGTVYLSEGDILSAQSIEVRTAHGDNLASPALSVPLLSGRESSSEATNGGPSALR